MKLRSLAQAAAFVAAFAMVASAVPAQAQSKAEAKCRSTIAKNFGKHVDTAIKGIAKCHKSADGGKANGTDCNDAVAADSKDKLTKTGGKLTDSLSGAKSKCTGLNNVLAQFPRCPSPNQTEDDAGATDGIDDFAELAACLVAMGPTWTSQAAADILGPSAAAGLADSADEAVAAAAKDLGKCRSGVAKGWGKLVKTTSKDRGKCQSSKDKDNVDGVIGAYGNGELGACATSDPKTKIAGAQTKLDGSIDKSCTADQAVLDALGMCGDTAAGLKDCTANIGSSVAGGLAGSGWGLPSSCAADTVEIFINSGFGSQLTGTALSAGWKGAGHDVDVIDGFHGRVSLSCNDDDCADCNPLITPVLTDTKAEPWGTCRCTTGANVGDQCDVLNGVDADDCTGGQCDCFFGPPLPLSGGGVPACAVNKITAELDGTADLGTGESTTTVANSAFLYTDGSLTVPCPVCDGDTGINDGTADGTCLGGDNDLGSCDSNGSHGTFGETSYDCPPGSGSLAGTIQLPLVLTTDVSTLDDTLTCTGNALLNCACANCSGDSSIGCNSDQICIDALAGTCTANDGVASLPDDCSSSCSDEGLGDGSGDCLDAPNMFCAGQLRANGTGLLACLNNAACDALDTICDGGDCGDCTVSELKDCFTYPITGTGKAGNFGSDLAATFCTATAGGTLDAAAGNPGPGRLVVNFDYTGNCSDGSAYQQPGGLNCPGALVVATTTTTTTTTMP